MTQTKRPPVLVTHERRGRVLGWWVRPSEPEAKRLAWRKARAHPGESYHIQGPDSPRAQVVKIEGRLAS